MTIASAPSLPMKPSRPDRCHARRWLRRRTTVVKTGGPFTTHQLQPCSGSLQARWAPEDVGRRLERAKGRRLRGAGHRQWPTTDETAPARGRRGATAPARRAAVAEARGAPTVGDGRRSYSGAREGGSHCDNGCC
jgi:hypothetical protein